MYKLECYCSVGIVLLAACSFAKHTTIVENTNNHRIKIEYVGHIAFNNDETGLAVFHAMKYLEYQNDERKQCQKRWPRG